MTVLGDILKVGGAPSALPAGLLVRGLQVGGALHGLASATPGGRLLTMARDHVGQAEASLAKLRNQFSPLQQGQAMRLLQAAPGLQLLQNSPGLQLARQLGLPGIDINPFDDIARAAKDALDRLQDLGGRIKDELKSLPSDAANAVADSMRGPKARTLTPGEEAKLREVFGDSIDLSNVRIVDGPGYNPDAWTAFNVGGNPAITEGNTVYVRSDVFQKDFSTSPEGIETLVHEFTHVRQYQEMGFGSFFAKYAKDLATIGDRNKVYDYQSRPNTTFATETIEGQAQMVGDYARYKAGGNNLTPDQVRDIERRLRGTGIFGL